MVIISPLLRVGKFGPSGWDFTLFRLDGLATGMLLAGLLRDPRSREFAAANRGIINAVAIGLTGADLLFASSPQYPALQRIAFGISLNSLAAGAVILSLQINPGNRLSKALSQSWLVITGRYSYFLYLMHVPILIYTMAGYDGGPRGWFVLIAFGLTFLGAWVSWRFLESRLIDLGKQRSYATKNRPDVPGLYELGGPGYRPRIWSICAGSQFPSPPSIGDREDIPVESHGSAPVAQLDRASGFEPEGREFESLRARQLFSTSTISRRPLSTPETVYQTSRRAETAGSKISSDRSHGR